MSFFMRPLAALPLALALSALLVSGLSSGQESPAAPAPDEAQLGEFVVTGTVQEHVPKIAILPSRSPAYEDVIVHCRTRGEQVVRVNGEGTIDQVEQRIRTEVRNRLLGG